MEGSMPASSKAFVSLRTSVLLSITTAPGRFCYEHAACEGKHRRVQPGDFTGTAWPQSLAFGCGPAFSLSAQIVRTSEAGLVSYLTSRGLARRMVPLVAWP